MSVYSHSKEGWWTMMNIDKRHTLFNCMVSSGSRMLLMLGSDYIINPRSPSNNWGEEIDFFNWCCKGSSVEIYYRSDYYMDYVLVLAGCFCLHFLSCSLALFRFLFISMHFMPMHFFCVSIHFNSFPFISQPLMNYINTSEGPTLYSLPIYRSLFLKNFGNEELNEWDMNGKWIRRE